MHKMDPKCAKSPTPPNHGTTTFQHVPSDMGGKCSIYEKKGSHFLSYFVYTLFVCTRCIVKSTISMLPWRQSLHYRSTNTTISQYHKIWYYKTCMQKDNKQITYHEFTRIPHSPKQAKINNTKNTHYPDTPKYHYPRWVP